MHRRSFLGVIAAGRPRAARSRVAVALSRATPRPAPRPQPPQATHRQQTSLWPAPHFVAMTPSRHQRIEMQSGRHPAVVGPDIAVADEMASRLGFTYDFEPQEFRRHAGLLSRQATRPSRWPCPPTPSASRPMTSPAATTSRSLACSPWAATPSQALTTLPAKSIACTHRHAVQNKFVIAVLPNADVRTYDGGDQCLQEVRAGRIDARLCVRWRRGPVHALTPTKAWCLAFRPRRDWARLCGRSPHHGHEGAVCRRLDQ